MYPIFVFYHNCIGCITITIGYSDPRFYVCNGRKFFNDMNLEFSVIKQVENKCIAGRD